MKRGCKNGNYKVNDLVYFTVIVDEQPFTVKYKILEKIENNDGFSYVIDAVQEQEDPVILELIQQRRIGTNIRICGDSLFKSKEDAVKKARDYFHYIAGLLDKIS